ncbi:MAG: radical SAM protein, partial [Deltaproteobacteria bacterium]|nr:radical SAM protein [Deltaproteobacteria bacterium]
MQKPVKKNRLITAVVANSKGEIFELEGYGAVGMTGSALTPLMTEDTINMPFGGELMFLPDRKPILYNTVSDRIETLIENPFVSGEKIFPVAAFNSPGYVT